MNDEQRPGRPQGHDLIFLSEFPMGLLSDRQLANNPTSLSFTVGEKELTIRAYPDFGLPTPTDSMILLCLLEETVRQGCPATVEFSRYRLLRRLGWQRNSERYARVHLGLDRLVGTTYYAVNHYPNPKGKQCVRRQAFHLLEAFDVRDSPEEGVAAGPSWVRWSQEILALLPTHQLKLLDLDQYLEFKSAIAQSLYRYLHTRGLNGKAQYAENLETLCFERLGLSRCYDRASQLKRKLDVAHVELQATGFITDATYAPMADGIHQKVVYRFPLRARAPVEAALPMPAPPLTVRTAPPRAPVVARLIEIGVAPRVAAALVQQHAAVVETQLAYWPHRDPVKNPGGALRRAIEENWEAPESWEQARKQQQQTAKAHQRREQEQAREEQQAEAAAAFDAWWATLPIAQQEAHFQAAKVELLDGNALMTQHYERHPDRLYEAVRGLLMQLTEWQPPADPRESDSSQQAAKEKRPQTSPGADVRRHRLSAASLPKDGEREPAPERHRRCEEPPCQSRE